MEVNFFYYLLPEMSRNLSYAEKTGRPLLLDPKIMKITHKSLFNRNKKDIFPDRIFSFGSKWIVNRGDVFLIYFTDKIDQFIFPKMFLNVCLHKFFCTFQEMHIYFWRSIAVMFLAPYFCQSYWKMKWQQTFLDVFTNQ